MMSDSSIFSQESYSTQSKHFRPYFAKTKLMPSDAYIYDLTELISATPLGAVPRDSIEPIQLPDSSTEDEIEEPFNPPEPEELPVPDSDVSHERPSHA